jgi:endo-1,4-beta-xylanase
VYDASGTPLDEVGVRAEMLQHEFKFGTAVVSNRFNGGSAFDPVYEQKLLNLDGKGHGFNEVVFENDLKWPGWEDEWFSTKPELASDFAWLTERGISVRGHNLVWPAWQYSPADINASTSPAQLRNRVRGHINALLTYPGIGTACSDWDVLNEITYNNDYADKLGRPWYAEVFRQADSLAPNSVLYLNDYVAIENADNPTNGIALWRSRLEEMLAAGAPVEGIGFQGHFSASPTGIPRVKAVYDAFWAAYGLEAKVTEYDINRLATPAIQAQYMRDILTVSFAHPSMKGFLMWGFWDGAHWLGNAPIYAQDWTLKPSGEAFVDQVFNQWWTDAFALTNALGSAQIRGYKGKYRVSVACPDGSVQSQEMWLNGDKTVVFNTPCAVSSTTSPDTWAVQVAPNPAHTAVSVRWDAANLQGDLQLSMINALGQQVHQQTLAASAGQAWVPVGDWPEGVYILQLAQGTRRVFRRVAVE